ncbi:MULTISPECIES: AAA family ATPase [unclassified Microcoleus]
MRLDTIFIRFYKSFNVDHARQYLATDNESTNPKKPNQDIKKLPWEMIKADGSDLWFPFIRVPIEPQITAVVGANESGKSHLLTAIEKAITGHDYKDYKISASDFCRYSDRFLITADKSRIPDFVTEWSGVSTEEADQIKALSEIPKAQQFDRFYLLRKNVDELIIYLPDGKNPHPVKSDSLEQFQKILPRTRRLDTTTALPDSVPIQKLVQIINGKPEGTRYELLSFEKREKIRLLLDKLIEDSTLFQKSLPPTPGAASDDEKKGTQLINDLLKELEAHENIEKNRESKQEKGIRLAYDMICSIAKISTTAIVELANAMAENDIGYTQALIDQINKQLSANLNFPKYWLQDNKFQILVQAKDHNLEFSIVDRTGTKYSFEERSSGLKYFLSYFIQHRSYKPPNSIPEILLMDEPDTYLSSQAQQDLLKIFEEVASSEDGTPSSQVVYVTHSPFLIDKNHSERIRVLNKGIGYEGTQVVKSAANNRYEPLRSSLGAFVAETVYISQCNLMVEGSVDQVLLAGAATYLLRSGASKRETLNLNEITIVPAGGTGNVPYMTFLARSRDTEQAAVIVLMDSDSDGNEAKRQLTEEKYGWQKTPLLKQRYVLQIGDLRELGVNLPEKLKDAQIEDIIPLRIGVLAARRYAEVICGLTEPDLKDIKEEEIQKKLNEGMTMFKAIYSCVEAASKDKPRLSKLPFARYVIKVVEDLHKKSCSDQKDLEPKDLEALNKFNHNFKILFRELDERIGEAELERTREKASEKIGGLEESFFNNHPNGANKEDAVGFLHKLNVLLIGDTSFDAEAIIKAVESIRKDYQLDTNLTERIEKYEDFQREIKGLKYRGQEKTGELAEEG